MFLSIIIPVYNGTKTIKRCLDSIWSQGLPENDYEVICVDDCSTDGSYDYILNLSKHHPQLKVLKNNINLRAGGARNHGVTCATGKYILFIDADDYFYPKAVKKAFTYQQSANLDVLMLDFSRQHFEHEESKITLSFVSSNIMDGIDFMSINTCPFGPCKFIFKKKLMIDYNIWFEEKCCCEDVDWCFRLVLAAKSIQYLPEVLSVVIINSESQTAIEHKSIKTISDKLYAAKRLYDQTYVIHKDNTKLASYILSVIQLYWFEGIKYMTACNSSIKTKAKILKEYIYYTDNLSPWIKFAYKYPFIYAFATNICSFVVPALISIKRKIIKR